MPSFWNGKWLGANTNSDSELIGKTSPTSSLNRCMVKVFFFQCGNPPFIVISLIQYLQFNVPKCKQILYYMRFDTSFIFATMWHPFQGPGIYVCWKCLQIGNEEKFMQTCWVGLAGVETCTQMLYEAWASTHDATARHMKWYQISECKVKGFEFGIILPCSMFHTFVKTISKIPRRCLS